MARPSTRPPFNKAIAEISAGAGGGTLIFPAGTYVCFTIRLASNVALYLSHGCTILAADSPRPGDTTGYNGGTYDPAGPVQAWEAYRLILASANHWPNSLFYGEGLHEVSILGPGLIHGKGLSHGSGHVGEMRGPDIYYKAEQAGVGNKAISLKNSRNVLLRDFFHPQRRPLRAARHRRRQHDARQPAHRYRPRWLRYRLLQECSRLQLHGQLSVGRRHLPEVFLCARLYALDRQCHHRQQLRHRLL